ncbi:Sal-like protein 4 [Myotis brandtii]|uniref:Sal-like protein 4 n=1 Tax=Myotis brandtii TaxID=109478 RepID=S7Q5S1_MYOBR|nr:Sal-like protein 4 [Myotis brandtii]
MALLSQEAGGQGLSLDILKQAQPPHANIPSTTSSVSPGLVPFALRPDRSRVLPSYLPGALTPQSPFSTVVSAPSKKGKGKPPNVPPEDVKPKDEAALYRNKRKH